MTNYDKNLNYYLTLTFLILLVCINIWMIVGAKQPWFISSLNIFFHEAGHWVFGIFGHVIGVLGGMLGELTMPSLFIAYFWLQKNVAGQVFSWWWLSTALYSTSIYIADARARDLYIIGGQGGHDWAYLLGRWGLLNQDIFISRIFIFLACIVTCYMAYLTYRYMQLQKGVIISEERLD